MNEYIQLANLALNALLVPLLAMQWRTRVDMATAAATVTALAAKLEVADIEVKRLRERMHDALNHIAEIKAILNMRKTERK